MIQLINLLRNLKDIANTFRMSIYVPIAIVMQFTKEKSPKEKKQKDKSPLNIICNMIIKIK